MWQASIDEISTEVHMCRFKFQPSNDVIVNGTQLRYSNNTTICFTRLQHKTMMTIANQHNLAKMVPDSLKKITQSLNVVIISLVTVH